MPVPADAHLPIAHSASDATIILPAMVPATSVLAPARVASRSLVPAAAVAMFGLLTVLLWRHLAAFALDAGLWSGPNDEYLLQHRPLTAGLWLFFASNWQPAAALSAVVALFAWLGYAGGRPILTKILLHVVCIGIGLIAAFSFQLLMMPLGRWG